MTDSTEPSVAHTDLASPVAIVTGAARGIGLAITQALVASGWRVGAFDLSPALEPVHQDPAIHYESVDVRDLSQVEAATARTTRRFGRLDAVIANAAVGGPSDMMVDVDLAAMRSVFDINFFGTVHSVQSAVPYIRQSGGRGRIVLVGSLFAQQPVPGASPYISSKGAVQGLMHSLMFELAPAMTVNSVAPGYIMTEMHREELEFRAAREGTSLEAQIDAVRRLIPLARHGASEDVAAAVEFLLSPQAGYISGQTINVNGGVQIS